MYVKYYCDQVALPEALLKDSELEIIVRAKNKGGGVSELPRIKVPRVLSDQFNIFQVITVMGVNYKTTNIMGMID